MANVSHLARLGAAAQHFTGMPGGRSVEAIRPEDLAYALAGIKHPLARYYARVKYAGDQSSIEPLISGLALNIRRVAHDQHWRTLKLEKISKGLATLAVIEGVPSIIADRDYVLPEVLSKRALAAYRCPGCKGAKYIGGSVCGTCNGAGVKGMSEHARAQIAGISHKHWNRVWSTRYQQHGVRALAAMRMLVVRAVRERLKDE